MYTLFLLKNTNISTFSGSKQLCVGDIMMPAQLKTTKNRAETNTASTQILANRFGTQIVNLVFEYF